MPVEQIWGWEWGGKEWLVIVWVTVIILEATAPEMITVELQWLEHICNHVHVNMFETGAIRASEDYLIIGTSF